MWWFLMIWYSFLFTANHWHFGFPDLQPFLLLSMSSWLVAYYIHVPFQVNALSCHHLPMFRESGCLTHVCNDLYGLQKATKLLVKYICLSAWCGVCHFRFAWASSPICELILCNLSLNDAWKLEGVLFSCFLWCLLDLCFPY